MNNKGGKILDFLFIFVSSYFAAFSIGLSKKAQNPRMSQLKMISEIMIHGISGAIVGLLATQFVKETFLLCALSAIGGLAGQQLVLKIADIILTSIVHSKGYIKKEEAKEEKEER